MVLNFLTNLALPKVKHHHLLFQQHINYKLQSKPDSRCRQPGSISLYFLFLCYVTHESETQKLTNYDSMTFDSILNQGFSKRHQSKEISSENNIREYKNKTPV